MQTAHAIRCRQVMTMAWQTYRDLRASARPPEFSACLREAWAFYKRIEEASANIRAFRSRQHLRLSPSLIRSPVARAFGSNPINEGRHAYLTAVLGR